jgi:hypothetical protein
LKILYFGTMEWGSTSLQRFEALQASANHVYGVDVRMFLGEYVRRSAWTRMQIRLGEGPLPWRVSSEAVREAVRYCPDIFWVDQGISLSAKALRQIRKRTQALLVHYTPDSLLAPGFKNGCFPQAVREYDLCITTKEAEEPLYARLGAQRVYCSHKGYDPRVHRPIALDAAQRERFSCDVGFSGQRMEARAQSLCVLLENVPCRLHLYGRHWHKGRTGRILGKCEKGWVYGDDYARAIVGAKVCLAFLNREVGDSYTTRSIEIPATGGFMLAERTRKHQELFVENEEAVFFSDDAELVDKVRYYLCHEQERVRIARAGFDRVSRVAYQWQGRISECLDVCRQLIAQRGVEISRSNRGIPLAKEFQSHSL